MTTIRKLITAWAMTFVVSLLLPLASFAAVPSVTYDLSVMTTTISATVDEHTTAVTSIEYNGTDLQNIVSGKARSLLGLGGNLVATESTLPSKLYHYTDDATAALIEKSQLGLPGRTTYLTPGDKLSPLQAQIELALPQKNTATAVFEVSTKGLDSSKIILQRPVTGNVFNRGGGGTEILFDGPISLENIRRIK